MEVDLSIEWWVTFCMGVAVRVTKQDTFRRISAKVLYLNFAKKNLFISHENALS